jgi:carbohydrate-selective porin OprB
MVGAYNGDPRLKQGSLHSVDFSLRGPVFAIGEIGVGWNYEENSARSSGNFKIGGYYNGGAGRVFGSPTETERGRGGFYVVAGHVLVRWSDDPTQDRRLGVFGSLIAAPDQRINKVSYFSDAGLLMYGPSSKRARDFIGLAAVYCSYCRDLRDAEEIKLAPAGVQNFEMTLELNYGWTIRLGLLFEPDLQYVVHSNGNTRLHNALPIGLNLVLNL